jgi:hypothetical protein
MRVVTPGQAARHTGSKYLGVLVAAKMARNLNDLRRNELLEDPTLTDEGPREKLTTIGIEKVREGKIIGRQHTYLRRIEGTPDDALMQSFVESHYTGTTFFPEEVWLSVAPTETGPIEAYLRQERGRKVFLRIPERGEKAELMRMAEANAELLLEEFRAQRNQRGAIHYHTVPRCLTPRQFDEHLLGTNSQGYSLMRNFLPELLSLSPIVAASAPPAPHRKKYRFHHERDCP